MGREVRGGIEMGKTCEPKAFSFQCMTKFTTDKKKKKKKERKWLTSKVLLYNTGNLVQCYMAAWMRGEFGEEWIHVYA